MKNLTIGIVLMLVAVLVVAACQPSQAADGPTATGLAVTEPMSTEPVATGSVATEPMATEAVPTEADVMPEGPGYTPATPPGGEAGGISDVLGGGGLAIVYERSGGFAGVMEKAEIYGDGRLVWSEDGQIREWQVPGARVAALRALIDAVDWAELAGSAPSSLGGQGADRFAYSLTVVREGKPLHVSWTEGQSGLPAGLVEVAAAIQAMILDAE